MCLAKTVRQSQARPHGSRDSHHTLACVRVSIWAKWLSGVGVVTRGVPGILQVSQPYSSGPTDVRSM